MLPRKFPQRKAAVGPGEHVAGIIEIEQPVAGESTQPAAADLPFDRNNHCWRQCRGLPELDPGAQPPSPMAAPVQRILNYIGEPAKPPPISPTSGSPAWDDPPVEAVPDWDALAQPQPEYVFDQQVQW